MSFSIRYEDGPHAYWIDGVRVPSITQVLKVATFDDFDRVDEKLLRRKAAEGTALAKAVEDYAAGRFDPTQFGMEILADFDAFVEWHESVGGTILHSETIVGSKRWGFAGRLDLLYDLPGVGESMIDMKRTHSPPASGGPQTAAQVEAFREYMGRPASWNPARYLLHIKNGRCTLVPQTGKEDWKVFLASLTVTKWRESNGKRY